MIFDYVADEFRKNGGAYLKKIFRNIFVEYRIGGLKESEAREMCEMEFDKYYSIYC